jgi:hypothetical protein
MPAGACHRAALCADPLAGMTAEHEARLMTYHVLETREVEAFD